MTPRCFTFGAISLTRSRCWPIGDRSDTPVTLPPGWSGLATSLAPSRSVTAVKTTGMSLVALTTVWAEGVEIGTMTSGRSPVSLRAIWAAVAGLPWALS